MVSSRSEEEDRRLEVWYQGRKNISSKMSRGSNVRADIRYLKIGQGVADLVILSLVEVVSRDRIWPGKKEQQFHRSDSSILGKQSSEPESKSAILYHTSS